MGLSSGRTGTVAPIGEAPARIRDWFDTRAAAAAADVEQDGSLQATDASARVFRLRGKSANTRAAYRSAVRAWCAWCATHGLVPPARRAARRLSLHRLGAHRPKTQRQHDRHPARRDPLPASRGQSPLSHRRRRGRGDRRRHSALRPEADQQACRDDRRPACPARSHQGRPARQPGSRALLVGFSGSSRRSELAGISIQDIERTDRGLTIELERSKASQEKTAQVPLPYGKTDLCPVRALTQWPGVADITRGPTFRRIWLAPSPHPDLPRPQALDDDALTPRLIARIV